jgi:uncharacterized protein (DUF1919 family)
MSFIAARGCRCISINSRPVRQSPPSAAKQVRRFLARKLERALIGREPVTILSEDCWGGEFCRVHGCAYTTPLAGAYIEPAAYLDFLENLWAPDAFELHWVASQHAYPVARTPYATIQFMHARSWKEIDEAFPRRVGRVNPDRLFFKIDFGKRGYTQNDVDRWNALALPNAIALLPPVDPPGLNLDAVHQGLQVRAWTHDGEAMLHWSRRDFDFHHWIRTGKLRRSRISRVLHFLLWDDHSPSVVRRKLDGVLARRSTATAVIDRRSNKKTTLLVSAEDRSHRA